LLNNKQQQRLLLFILNRGTMGKRGRAGANLAEFSDGRDENNLAEFPLSVLTDNVPAGVKTLEFEDTMTDWESGQTITRRVCITGSDKFGLPRPKDEDVLLALIQFTKITNNFTSPEVYFTKRQIIELLGWENRGWAYDRLEESLHRWKGVSIHYKSAWREHAKRQWCDSEALGVIEYVKLTDSRRRPINAEGDRRSRIIWNKMLFDSFAAGYLKRLDYQTYRSLERPAARRAYRFLDKRFFHQPTWEFELRTFACEKIGLSRSYDTGQLKQRLQPALGELERIGFIAPVQYRKQRPKVWQIAISKASANHAAEAPPASASPLVEQLIKRGVAAAAASALVAECSVSLIEEKLKYFDWLVARKDKRVSQNPPGFLMAAIRKNYRPSKDYAKATLATAKTQRREPPTPSLRTTNSSSAETAESQAILDYLNTLMVEQVKELEERAAASASRVQLDAYRRLSAKGGKLWEEVRQSLLIGHVRQNRALLLGADQTAEVVAVPT
jgi:hypothetical protein